MNESFFVCLFCFAYFFLFIWLGNPLIKDPRTPQFIRVGIFMKSYNRVRFFGHCLCGSVAKGIGSQTIKGISPSDLHMNKHSTQEIIAKC